MTTTEREHSINGVAGRMFASHTWKESGRDLPTFATQTWKASREYREHNQRLRMVVTLGYDDDCRNGHNTFSATCDIAVYEDGRWRDYGGGAAHEEIARVFPELAPLLKWHLVSSDGPMHYLANTIYQAGDRDYNGLLKGETRQIRNGKTGQLAWKLSGHALPSYVDSDTRPEAAVTLQYEPWLKVGEGKARELDHARSSAVWPDATDEELTAPDLRERLIARLPQLLADFRTAMTESCGFEWSASP